MNYKLLLRYKIPNKLEVIDDYLDEIGQYFDMTVKSFGNATPNIELRISNVEAESEELSIEETKQKLSELMPTAIFVSAESEPVFSD